jgi:hypothetical protein
MGKYEDGRARRAIIATRTLALGALGTVAGVVASVVGLQAAGAVLTLSGILGLLWGLHRVGRLGADPPTRARSS